ncbi:hypothetical protein Poli38472_006365 [Pythium oligandrum]|uniref:Lipoyl-binding domain-containing protein n=1 Tax=Pythium oligandrum TaxID=41045 RepID=A0A8K1FAL3_PYTOL|nr:hypothetical protein Poli38472_006365 [Pythium oligandrum]|eukprot:TMW56355.1 hypothetical protein Poli38472_006365 [Pythium oligandrum]
MMLARALRSASSARRSALLLRGFASYPAHEVVGLPALSPTMEQGNLASWRLKEGDKISAGDIICQIETDKAVVDFEAQDDMFLAKILVPEGTENISVGQPIMVTCEEEDDVAAFKDFKVEASEVAAPAAKAPEEQQPKKEEAKAPAPAATPAPAAAKPAPAAAKPAPPAAKPTPAPAAPAPTAKFAEKWGHGSKKSPLSFSLVKKQQAYLDLYGLTGTTPVSKN